MDIINFFVNLLSDPRAAIAGWIIALGPVWVYTPLFLIVFVETGLVFFPFLPGDSLLFAAGVFSADGGGLHVLATLIIFSFAAILGNTSNYWIARFFGSRIIDSGKIKSLTPERMAKLDYFFERYGGLTIIITRFMPFFRTFAPFINADPLLGPFLYKFVCLFVCLFIYGCVGSSLLCTGFPHCGE